MQKLTQKEYLEKCKIIHNNKYDYSLVEYTNIRADIKIICPTRGKFLQKAGNHLKWGCSKCTYSNIQNVLIQKGNLKFNNKFDYSKVNYVNNRTNVIISCPIHGEFKRRLWEHVKSPLGCLKCQEIHRDKIKIKNICHYCKNYLEYKDRIHIGSKKLTFHTDCYKKFMRENQLLKDYGITFNEYVDIYNKQNKQCAICSISLDLISKNTNVYHCHNSLKVRGILCTKCNKMLGCAQDNIDILKNAILYLKDENVFHATGNSR